MNHKQQVAWQKLTPNQRRMLLSHRPGELERDEAIQSSTLSDLVAEFGPQQWDATLAVIAEGEGEQSDTRESGYCVDGCYLQEVADAIGLSRERTRQIEQEAMAKIRRNPLMFEVYYGYPPDPSIPSWEW